MSAYCLYDGAGLGAVYLHIKFVFYERYDHNLWVLYLLSASLRGPTHEAFYSFILCHILFLFLCHILRIILCHRTPRFICLLTVHRDLVYVLFMSYLSDPHLSPALFSVFFCNLLFLSPCAFLTPSLYPLSWIFPCRAPVFNASGCRK